MKKDYNELFSRHILLESFGCAAQEKLSRADICVIGCGGLGCGALPYLVAAGVGKITFVDFGGVELSNLQRQPLYGPADVGVEKVDVAYEKLQPLSHSSELTKLRAFVDSGNIAEILGEKFDLVVDCTDNFEIRYLLADYLWKCKIPLLSAAVLEFSGHIFSLVNVGDNPCLRCLMAEPPEVYKKASDIGVFGPAVGVMGSMQAVEAVKMLAGIGEGLEKTFLNFDFMRMRVHKMEREKNASCAFCV